MLPPLLSSPISSVVLGITRYCITPPLAGLSVTLCKLFSMHSKISYATFLAGTRLIEVPQQDRYLQACYLLELKQEGFSSRQLVVDTNHKAPFVALVSDSYPQSVYGCFSESSSLYPYLDVEGMSPPFLPCRAF